MSDDAPHTTTHLPNAARPTHPGRVAFLHDPQHHAHHGPLDHPERPARLDAILKHLDATGRLARCDVLTPDDLPPERRDARDADLQRCHPRPYLDAFADACVAERPYFMSPDTPITGDTETIARRATGLALHAARHALQTPGSRAFCAIRPPGHHATADQAMGFCFYNHAALVADVLLNPQSEIPNPKLKRVAIPSGRSRVAILDFDVHHGNGTQALTNHRGDILFLSLHEDPNHQYPGTGHAHETGTPNTPGQGHTVNAPLPTGTNGDAFLAALDRDILPRLADFAPDALVFSAGFDAHADDPLGGLHLTTACYHEITHRTVAALPDHGRATPVISLLEGGYNTDALAASVAAHLDALAEH
ncbi:MAG: histone deacetylase [Planctomycetota bacterium]